MQDRRILIFSNDSLISALLAALLETEHIVPAFPQRGESADQAVERTRPSAILIDMEHPDSSSDVFLARMRRAKVGVLLFSSSRSHVEARQIARERALPWFVLPIDRDALRRTLDEVLQASRGKP